MTACWLVKTEPGCFSIDDLAKAENQTSMWDGVRNYQARNFIRDDMKPGDRMLFYHSVTDPGIVGLAEVVSKPYPDPTQWDPEAEHYDPTSAESVPRWWVIDVRFKAKFKNPLPLPLLRMQPELEEMELLRKGSRLSIQPVRPKEYDAVLRLEEKLQKG